MEIIEITSKPPRDDIPLILLIGKFDGIHLGHQAILHKARELKNENETLAVMSFSDHPRWILREDKEYKNKMTPEKEKARVLKQFGVERIYNIAFTKEYADITAREFFLEHISRLQVKRIIIGDDFHFGKGREGSVSDLAELC
ncbi:adenylyltransferase/cytidyltransferase family protein [Neobacillus terrae]|uniref:adenylyltransferase/cytidyltransferase family protein n=1 Tax=Neobacillus terrae TaxID=3034837 RepID=UPI00140A2FE1|nr:adenylyltransferase/cytidyltransferase family protein [Neobacillus terrae]NHM30642.1 adenylyltransferase/cytidyltransferase family protein [Neobacillus terrae]